jgi:hypothetical protein
VSSSNRFSRVDIPASKDCSSDRRVPRDEVEADEP